MSRMAESAHRENMLSALERMRKDNERLRWRHPNVIPEWNDLPQDLRSKLVEIGSFYADGNEAGGDLAVNFYGEIRRILAGSEGER